VQVEKIFIVGSGLMGSGIAQVALTAGYRVTLNDLNLEILEKARAGIDKMLSKSVSKGKMSTEDKNDAMSRIALSDKLSSASDVDMVIEAAPEKVEVKKTIFKELSGICREDTIFVTNTSSISISLISSIVKNPDRFIGMHFFSPVPLMELVEIVRGLGTSAETVATARGVGEKFGKKCIVLKDSPGFVVNRMLVPMLNEACFLFESGIGSIEDIDAGMRYGLNHPIGPFELMDMSGVDVAFAALEVIFNETGDSKYRPSHLFKNMVRMGWLGYKTGKGFYIYNEDGSKTANPDLL